MVKSQAGCLAVLRLKRNTEGVTTSAQFAVVGGERQSWVYGGLVFTMFIWGLAWPVGKLLATNQNLPPVSIAALRYAIVVPVLFAILWLKEGSFKINRSWIPTLVVMGILNTTLYQIFFLYGVKYAAASDDSLVIGIGPVLIAIMASFVLKERFTWTKILGFASGLAGIITISILSPNTQVLNRPLGVTLVFGGAAAYALYTVLLRRFLSKNRADNNGPQQSSLSILTWISLFGWFLDVHLGRWLVAWNSLPCHTLDCSRIFPLHRRCLEDWGREISDLWQSRPSLRRPNLRPHWRNPEPLDRCQLPTHLRGSPPC